MPKTLEGRIIRFCDKIAYINHDIDDAVRCGEMSEEDIPKEISKVLGKTHSERINTMICGIIAESANKPKLEMNSEILEAMTELRKFMFDNVYLRPFAREEEKKTFKIIESLYDLYVEKPELMGEETLGGNAVLISVRDYIAGMTDRFALNMFEKFFIPQTGK